MSDLSPTDLGWWIEAECYNLRRLEHQETPVMPQQIAAIRNRLWRIHELLEDLSRSFIASCPLHPLSWRELP